VEPLILVANESGAEADFLEIRNLGLVDYEKAWTLQREIHHGVASGNSANTLLLLEHPSVFTAGRMTKPEDRPMDATKVIDVDRGGKITWHGPGQIVGYPIVKLADRKNVVGFVRTLEEALIQTCQAFGLPAIGYEDRSGVWIRDEKGDRKIAAVGLRVAKGVTMHGFALNVDPDLKNYSQIVPCGITDASVTSVSAELGIRVSVEKVLPILENTLRESLGSVSI
jgi:lipoyl(octanoyl) transferase